MDGHTTHKLLMISPGKVSWAGKRKSYTLNKIIIEINETPAPIQYSIWEDAALYASVKFFFLNEGGSAECSGMLFLCPVYFHIATHIKSVLLYYDDDDL